MNYRRTALGISDYVINKGVSLIYHDRARTFARTPKPSVPGATVCSEARAWKTPTLATSITRQQCSEFELISFYTGVFLFFFFSSAAYVATGTWCCR